MVDPGMAGDRALDSLTFEIDLLIIIILLMLSTALYPPCILHPWGQDPRATRIYAGTIDRIQIEIYS